jgi:hypothetical protein
MALKIMIETKLKQLPKSCAKCPMSIKNNDNDTRICRATSSYKLLEKTFVAEKNNYCYVVPDWCPMAEYDVEEE